MKDFKKKSLYESEQGRFEHVRKNRIETNTEYNQTTKYESGIEEEDDMPTEFLSTSFDGLDSFDGLGSIDSGGFGDFGNFGMSTSGVDESWRQGKVGYEQFLYSLPLLCKHVFEQMSDGKNTKEEWKNVMKPLQIFGAGLFIVSLLSKFVGLNTPHIPMLGIFVGLTVVAACVIIDYQVYQSGPIARFKGIVPVEAEETKDESDPFGFGMPTGDSDVGDMDFFNMGTDSFGTDNLSLGSETMENSLEFNDSVAFGGSDYAEDEDDADDLLPPSDVNIHDDEDFELGLLEQYKKNSKFQGRYLPERKKLLDSFSGMMVTNDKKFSKWVTEPEHSPVYDNIGYTLYKALIDINKSFSDAEGSGSKITIMDISSSPLMYKIEMRLPAKYFKPAVIERSVETFENYLKIDAADTQVQCLISTSSDIYTFRFLRLDYKGLISIGDIMRYRDDSGKTPYEKFNNPKLGAPMLVGLRDNEYPHIVDLEANTAMAIVGGSGSGKSWLTYELGVNLVTSNDYNEVQFIVLDAKNATFWKTFARMPHVLGYHSDVSMYLDIAREVEAEMNRRQEMLGEFDMEDFVEARRHFKGKKDYENLKKFPLLVFVIDEITSTMNTLEGFDEKKETQKAFISSIENISQKGRSAGVRLLTIGQRAVNASLPKNVRANSSMLFGMKMNAESDFNILFDGSKKVEKMKKPIGAGLGIMTSEDINGYHNLKTLTPGGKDTPQIRTFLRVMALDWIRRAAGRDDLYKKPVNTQYDIAYNRPKFLDETYAELSEGRILNKLTVSKGLEIDLLHEAIKSNDVQRKNVNTFTEEQRETIVESHKKPVTVVVEEPIAVVEEDFEEVENVFVSQQQEIEETVAIPVKKQIQFPDLTDFINNLNLEEDDDEEDEEESEFSFENDDSYQHDLFNAKKELFDRNSKGSKVEDAPIKKSEVLYKAPVEPDIIEEVEEETIVESEPIKKENIVEPIESKTVYAVEEPTVLVEEETILLETEEPMSGNLFEESDFGDLFDDDEEDEEDVNDLKEEPIVEVPVIKPKVNIPVQTKVVEKPKVIDKPIVEKPKVIDKPIKQFEEPKKVNTKQPNQPAVVKKEAVIEEVVERNNPIKEVLSDTIIEKPVIKPPTAPKRPVQPKNDNLNGGVKMQFNTPTAKKKETPNISIQQYIIENGVKVGAFESALPKDVLDNVYTKNQINKAIRAMEIMSTKDSYIASL